MRRWSGNLSRWLNRMLGGEAGQSLCARVAARWSPDCAFCRVVGWFTEESHCAEELRTFLSRRDS